jgi:hypothetical protein
MSTYAQKTITGSAPSTATTAVVGTPVTGLEEFDTLEVTATFGGNTGGALDVYLQRYDDGLAAWVDWVHFAQKATAAASNTQAVSASTKSATIVVVGTGTTVALAAATAAGGHPGRTVRCLAVSGASTTVGATITVSIRGKRTR